MKNTETRMKARRIIALVICMVLIAGAMSYASAAELRVNPTGSVDYSHVFLDGKMIVCSAYNINGNNYFKLRDIMQELNIYVGYDSSTKTIDVNTAMPYEPDGSESTALIAKNSANGYATEFFPAIATLSTASVRLNGQPVDWAAYNIYGNNHFKLRDIGEALDISIEYNDLTKDVKIDTSRGYGEEAGSTRPVMPKDIDPPTAEELEAAKMEIIRLTNVERAKVGLSELKVDQALMNCAQMKADDMAENNYFSHRSPIYGTSTEMIFRFVPNAITNGENIARGNYDPEEVMKAFMDSPGHREPILEPVFTHIGIGISCIPVESPLMDGTTRHSWAFRIVQQFATLG